MNFLFRSIRTKIFVLMLSVFFFFSAFYAYVEFDEINKEHFENFEITNNTIQKILFDNMREFIYKNDIQSMQMFIDSIENEYIDMIHIVTRDGKVIVSTIKQYEENCQHFHDYINKTKKIIIEKKDFYLIVEPFLLLDVPMAYLVVEGNLEKYHEDMHQAKMNLMQIIVLGAILVVMISFYIAKSISHPIEMLVEKLSQTKDSEILELGEFKQEEFAYLGKVIEKKHNELQDLNVDLGLQVLKQTNALQMLNESLEDRIEQAVEENRQKDKQMLQQSRLAQMGEMLSMIAHQWRQPLAAIGSTASAIELKAILNQINQEELIQNVQNISEYAQHLSTTVDDFREFFKDNKLEVQTSYEEIVQSVLKIVQTSLESKNIELEVNYKTNQQFKTFPNKLKQVVLNLIKNAEDVLLEKEIEKPKISIDSYELDGMYILSVRDNATGISEDILPFIFDPYFTTKEKKDGTGLGLYMSKIIVEEHCKGKLEVQTSNNGTTFSIVLKGN